MGQEATSLFIDAQNMLRKIIDERWLTAKARFGLFPVNSKGDDILVFDPNNHERESYRFITLRQQLEKRAGQPNIALSDFIAPESLDLEITWDLFALLLALGWRKLRSAMKIKTMIIKA